jgi:hypothetical protein
MELCTRRNGQAVFSILEHPYTIKRNMQVIGQGGQQMIELENISHGYRAKSGEAVDALRSI